MEADDVAIRPDSRLQPTVLSLCAGIGGLDVAIHEVFGSRTACYVELESFCAAVLVDGMEKKALDRAPIWDDIRTFDGEPWGGKVSIVAAGYPCSPFSYAGRGLAEKDPRHLWPEVRRIIEETYPAVVVLENVQAHIRRGLKEVLRDLDGLGFDAEWGVFTAAESGAPHRRARVFVLAYCRSRGLEVLRGSGVSNDEQKFRSDPDGCRPAVADCGSERLQGKLPSRAEARAARRSDRTEVADAAHSMGAVPLLRKLPMPNPSGDACSRLSVPPDRGMEDLSLFPPGPEGNWDSIPAELQPAIESQIRGVAHAGQVASRMDRLRALGNAVVPAQGAYALINLITQIRRNHE